MTNSGSSWWMKKNWRILHFPMALIILCQVMHSNVSSFDEPISNQIKKRTISNSSSKFITEYAFTYKLGRSKGSNRLILIALLTVSLAFHKGLNDLTLEGVII